VVFLWSPAVFRHTVLKSFQITSNQFKTVEHKSPLHITTHKRLNPKKVSHHINNVNNDKNVEYKLNVQVPDAN